MLDSGETGRLDMLEEKLRESELDGLWLDYTDRFLNEFIPPSDRRLEWLTSFTGSAGLAILGAHGKHALFVDGRYTLQARQEVDPSRITVLSWTDEALVEWITASYQEGACLGVDPWCQSVVSAKRYQTLLERLKLAWQPLTEHPIDDLWEDRPLAPQTPFNLHPPLFSGTTSLAKRQAIIEQATSDAWLLSSNASLAWLLNVRGNDLPCTPVNRCYGILFRDGTVEVFVPSLDQLSPDVEEAIQPCRLYLLKDLPNRVAELESLTVSYDPAATPHGWVLLCKQHAPGITFRLEPDPCLLPKACKNKVELEQTAQAHQWDGAAWVTWRHWLTTLVNPEQETELSVARKLESLRQEHACYVCPSFETIAAVGSNGAIVHYHPKPSTNQCLKQGQLLLVDSGGQYRNGGTTDTTRTLALGQPTPDQKAWYTRVLKGQIALTTCRFPEKTKGLQLDSFARRFLWDVGCDYHHSTGHGVGSFLGVHEGPQGISSRHTVCLQQGMLLSNEPGYYEAGQFGIRLENVIQVVPHDKQGWLGFQTLTLVPFEADLVNFSLLSETDLHWLAHYHQEILDRLEDLLPQPIHKWLKGFVAPFFKKGLTAEA